MITRTHVREENRSMRIRFRSSHFTTIALGLSLTLLLCGGSRARAETVSAPPAVLSLASAPDGDHVIFVVELALPPDMTSAGIQCNYFGNNGAARVWPREAQLRTQPAWATSCYQICGSSDRPDPLLRRDCLTFVGRCAPTASLTLTLRYPVARPEWRESELTLDLAHATALPAEPVPLVRFARAQAEWFERIGASTGDVGGFFEFAAQQSRRMHGLPVDNTNQARRRAERGGPNAAQEELYDVTTGALAVQESLQLDRMTATDCDRGERTMLVKDIAGVGVKSHPFDEMRGGKPPVDSGLARLVPEDFYYLRFENIAKLLELLDLHDQWGTSLLRLATPVGTDYRVRERVHRQLCLPATLLTRILGPNVISEMALVGSDPYLQEGSDLSVLFRVKHKAVFLAAVETHLQEARKTFPDAVSGALTHQGIAIERLVDAERRVSCHRCWLDDVCVYSNSLVALQRVIDAYGGRAPNLADAPDYQYMRSVVFPLDPAQEDGFLYLSDAFVRRLVGPELRIAEKRRLEAVTSLKMVANAALLHGYLYGPGTPTLDDLTRSGVLTLEDVFDPAGGAITWDAQRGIARSSVYGDLSFLTPLLEIETDRATEKESRQYAQFRDRYQQYWRQYFDPIGVRLCVGKTVRLETCILPLIDLSAYNDFQDIAGGDPIEIRPDRFTPSTVLRFVIHLNDGNEKRMALETLNRLTGTNLASDWLGEWLTFWVEDSDALTTLVRRGSDDVTNGYEVDPARGQKQVLDFFSASFALGAHVRNKLSLAALLVSLRAFIQQTAPNTVVFNNLEPYRGVTLVQIAPDPSGYMAWLGSGATSQPTTTPAGPSERGPALYYATIQDGFYLATQASVLRRLIDQAQNVSTTTAPAEPVRANLCLYAAPSAAAQVRPALSALLERQARRASIRNMAQVWVLGHSGILQRLTLDEAACNYLGYRLLCPDGGAYAYDADADEATSSIHGRLSQPTVLDELPKSSPLGRLLDTLEVVLGHLRFTQEGITTTIEIRRD
jgi:hypothetical protein